MSQGFIACYFGMGFKKAAGNLLFCVMPFRARKPKGWHESQRNMEE
jgi:hypothetical protein